MRAVNLIPEGDRRNGGGAGGRSRGAAHALVGILAALVALVCLWTLEQRSAADTRAELATVGQQATVTEARAAELSSFVQFAALRAKRTQTVSSLAASRFDWSHALSELARVVPADVWLTGLQGTVAPGVTLKSGSAGPTSGLRAALPVPAVEIVGCSTSQPAVARMLTRMRLIDGVVRVALQSSSKSDAGGGGGGANGGDCRQGSTRYPQFAFVVWFDPAAGAVPTQAGGAVPIPAVAPSGATGPAATTAATASVRRGATP